MKTPRAFASLMADIAFTLAATAGSFAQLTYAQIQPIPQSKHFLERRQRAIALFEDGILLLHAQNEFAISPDSFRQDPYFYYFTGLENTVGAVLAIDGRHGESWLFLPSSPPFVEGGLQPEVKPGNDSAKELGIDHVVDWTDMREFLATRSNQSLPLYYVGVLPEIPPNLADQTVADAPGWLQVILQKWPSYKSKEASRKIDSLMEIQTPDEMVAVRSVAKATVSALTAGMRAIHPGSSQRSVELAVNDTCWKVGAHGSSFWPWAMAGENAVFPRPFFSFLRYDHLDRQMLSGELVRLDVGCEWNHYQGDLGRTVPVSGRYDDAQRETWSFFVAAYRAGVKALRGGVTVDEVFNAWEGELSSHRDEAKTALARHAIDSWSDRKKLPFWQIHTTNLIAGRPSGALQPGTTINFEPIASVDGQGFFLEDMYLITKDGAELLTPGVPYSAEEIEATMN